ncbi:MAG TPA: serine/threonine-protein kinase [Holophaga sp.]|nr:serine/threonine-protein kinase [Holophaga sp.]
MSLNLPRMVGGARVMERLGEGGMAVVHRAVDPHRPGLPLAVKFLKAETLGNPEAVTRFLREGEVLRRLSHPNLVAVHDAGRAGSIPWILMELLPGGDVRGCFGEAPARVLRRLAPVTGALAVAHAAGVVHRDLKPSNLLFDGAGSLKVTDFGVCLWEGGEGTRMTRSQMVVGTLGYMAPEQHGDPRRVDGRCDVYALGAIAFEFTTGRAWSQVQLPPAVVRPGFPPRLARILIQALAPDPARRIPSMEALGEEWAGWLDSAEAAGWGDQPLPGFSVQDAETETVTRARPRADEEPQDRLGPYLDGLRTGGVGSRRNAAEGLVRSVRPGDAPFLLEELAHAPEGSRFALCMALGGVGSGEALGPLMALLEDPFAQREAAEAASLIAVREGREAQVLEALREPGLGAPWRWIPRARLGDPGWVQALAGDWSRLSPPLQIQALGAAAELPGELRSQVKDLLRPVAQRAGGQVQRSWEGL